MKKLRKLKKGLAILLTAAMVVGLMPGVGTLQVSAAESDENTVNTVSSNEAMTPEPTPEQTDGQATEKLITAWQWIDEEEILDEETGNLALPGASEQTPAYFDDVTAFLPTQIQATVVNADDSENPETGAAEEPITLRDWSCDNFPEEGAYSGSYTFTASLPEGYVLSEEAEALTVLVELGGATLYETATATWTYPTKTPTLTWAGSGTAEDPYIITTAQELANMSYIVNAGLQNSDGKNYYELCYKLGADIDIGGKQWVPIGGIKNGTSYSYTFRGSFDGDNHTISNLTFSAVNTNYEKLGRSGLFYEISGNAEIKNVKLENVNTSMKGHSGALVGYISNSYFPECTATISNCHVLSGTITSTSTAVQDFGGLIGGLSGSATITNCTNRATVTGSSTCNDAVGGIIGYHGSGKINISNCYNYGALSGIRYVGGIVGSTNNTGENTTISNCGNEGSINSQYYVGGIVGKVSIPNSTDPVHRYTISGCYNKGAITSTQGDKAGGIVGQVYGKAYVFLIIERCYNAGTVTSDIYGSYDGDSESTKYGTQAVSVKNCVYIGDKVAYFGTGDNDAFNRKVTAEELASGKATVYLNQGLSEENLIWYQNLSDPDKDNYPVTDSTHSKVYASGYCVESATFSNTAPETIANNHVLEHVAQVDAKCGISGLKGHYKCRNCGELFSDENGTKIVTLVDLVIQPTATDHNYVDGICSVCGDFKTPTQNEEGYYLIYTLGELISYADMASPNDGEVWMPIEEPTAVSQKVRLMADIDMSSVYNAETGKSWEPIGGGNGDGYFKGDFDGNGHTISGLYINSTTVQYAGLFGRLMFGVCCVHDLTLKDVSINAPNATAAGAVVGFVDSYKKSPTIKNCMVESGTIKGKDYVGGIAGKTSSGQQLSASEEGEIILIDSGYISVIQNCGNNATVTATTYAGGLSGYGPVWIEDSYNTGTVTGTTSGQITGYLSENSRVNNCYYLGSSDTAFCVNSTDAENVTDVAYKSADEFANGGVAWLLNGKISENTEENPLAWYQKLGEDGDAFPVLNKSHGIVYVKSLKCDGNAKECSNTSVDDVPRDPHELEYCEEVAPKCDKDGHKACWKCKNCDTYFSDDSGNAELPESDVIIPATNIHSFDKNGMCTTCGKVYEPAELIDDVYQIKNAGNLAWFATLVNGDTYNKDGNTVERNVHANAVVLEDIDLSVICGPEKGSWVPIGSVSTPRYDGHFDGNYHTISNLYFNNTIAANVDSGGGKYAALFAYTTTGAVIENIIMTNVDITGFQYVGAVVGKNEYSTVKNCMVLSGSVKGTKGNVATGYNYGSGAGGIVGFGAGHIENCANFATVDGGSQVGGIVGTVYSRNSSDCTIVNCYNAGTVTGKLYVGEIVGQTAYYSSPTTDISVAAARCDVKNCYYTGVNAAVGLFQSQISVQAYSVTEQQLASGEVAYRLNGSLSAGELVWYQKLGENGDAYPVLKKNEQNDNTVYQYTNCRQEAAYTNDITLSGTTGSHDFSALGVCNNCNYEYSKSDLTAYVSLLSDVAEADYSYATFAVYSNAKTEAESLATAEEDASAADFYQAYSKLKSAYEALKPVALIVGTIANPSNTGKQTGGGRYAVGETVTLTAEGVNGWTFNGWYKDEKLISDKAEVTFTVTEGMSGTVAYTAKYTHVSHTMDENSHTCSVCGINYYKVTFTGAVTSETYTTGNVEFPAGDYIFKVGDDVIDTSDYMVSADTTITVESLAEAAKYAVTITGDAHCTLTVTDSNGNTVVNGDEVAAGTILKVSVKVDDGYKLTTTPASSYTVSEATTITAETQAKTYAVTVDNTYCQNSEAEEPTASVDDLSAVSYGTSLTLTAADANSGYEFLGWYQTNGKQLTAEKVYTVTITSALTVQPRYQQNSGTVTFMANDSVVGTFTGTSITEENLPETPAAPSGYEFDSWDKTVADINTMLADNQNVMVKATFKKISNSFMVSVYNGNAMEPENTAYEETTKIIVTAQDVADMNFAYWTLNGEIQSYNKTIAFYASSDCVLQAVYSDVVTTAKGTATLQTGNYDISTKRLSMVCYLTVPDGCTMVKAGVIAALGTSSKYNAQDELTMDNADYVKSGSNLSGLSSLTYTWIKGNVYVGDTWYARAYVTYTDSQNNTVTVYGDRITLNAGTDYDYTEKASAKINNVSWDASTKRATFVSYITVPDGAVMEKAGIVAANSSVYDPKTAILTTENAAYVKSGTNLSGLQTLTYTWIKGNVSSGDIWYARAYVIYKDEANVSHTVYGNIIKYQAE